MWLELLWECCVHFESIGIYSLLALGPRNELALLLRHLTPQYRSIFWKLVCCRYTITWPTICSFYLNTYITCIMYILFVMHVSWAPSHSYVSTGQIKLGSWNSVFSVDFKVLMLHVVCAIQAGGRIHRKECGYGGEIQQNPTGGVGFTSPKTPSPAPGCLRHHGECYLPRTRMNHSTQESLPLFPHKKTFLKILNFSIN